MGVQLKSAQSPAKGNLAKKPAAQRTIRAQAAPRTKVPTSKLPKPDSPKPASVKISSPKPAASGPTPLQKLLTLEGEAFSAKDRLALKHMAVNKPRSLIETGHIFFVRRTSTRFDFEAISSQSTVDKNAPFLQWIGRELTAARKIKNLAAVQEFTLTRDGDDTFDYPFYNALWAPFAPDASAGGLLFTRAHPWTDADKAIPQRLGQIYGLQWTALGRKKRARLTPRKRLIVGGCFLALAIAACIPVPVTTLAQAEIVAANPFIVSAPMDGVIKTLIVEPNTVVTPGTVLGSFEDTTYRNEHALAQQEMAVATARQRQTGLSAFVDQTTRRELAVTQAEQELAQTRETYAAQMLGKTVLRAQIGGLVLYSDKKDWMGRPVATGERIMEIADPGAVHIRLETSIHDSGALTDKARVKLFLDSDPLRPIEAQLTRSSYYAQPQAGGNLAYEGFAEFAKTETEAETGQDEDNSVPRIGSRGIAKIYGGTAPLGYWLLRRPLTSLRQFIGA